MALTKDDIDAALAQTENQDAIRHSLSNYFEDLNEPVAVAIGIGNDQFDREFHPKNVDKIVDLLRSNGIDAVSFLDPQAAQPDKFVVNESGVLAPFMSPQDSLKAATLIEDIVINNGYKIVGHVNPQVKENILYTSNASIKIKNDAVYTEQGINLETSCPDKELFKEIEQRNGGDYKSFIDKKINEAYVNSKVVDFDAIDKENVYANGMAELYRGGTLGTNPYATVSEWNSRKVAHSSPAISICAGFSGKEITKSSRGGAVYEKTQSGVYYGFIYKLESLGDEQKFYRNVGLETGNNPRTKDEVNYMTNSDYDPWNGHNGDIYESPVLPHHNKLKEMYIYVGQRGENEAKLFSIPLDENGKIADPEWRDFMALHEPTDDKVLGYLKDRQDAQKREQTKDENHVYNFELKQGLEPDNQEYLENVSTRDFLRNFIHDNEIEYKDGNLYVDAMSDGSSLNMEGLKIKNLPDLSNVKINGHWGLNKFTISEVDATKLPECTKGITLYGIDVKNVSALSADKFLKIIGADQTKEGFLDCETSTHNSISGDGMPQGFDKLKFMELPSFVNLVYDSIDKVPETLEGIGLSGVNVKDQSSIENMSAADFIHKIKGNMGTHPFGFDVMHMYSQGIRHTEIHDNIELNLEHTNINTFPREMKNLTMRRVILNRDTVVTSLDNFPITKEGILDLNFQGELKNETMESFLLKTKGTEWVANNTSKAQDGHLIINGDFNFIGPAWGKSGPQMNITSFPKDIENVEINGDVEPRELGMRLNNYLKVMKSKDNDDLTISHNTDLKMDLSNHRAKYISISGKTQEVILPPTTKSVSIEDSENFQVSLLKNMPQNLNLSFYNTNNEIPLDFTNVSPRRLSFNKSSVTEINFPQKVVNVNFSETQLNKPITLCSEIMEFSASSTNFPKGSVLNLGKCEEVSLINCTFQENTALDLSKCKEVVLSDIDLSEVNVTLPKSGKVIIGENVKFAPDFKLDLSNCTEGSIHPSVQCGELKLPRKLNNEENAFSLPASVKEISTTCIRESYLIKKFDIPPHVKIVDEPDESGKNVKLKLLKACGLSKEQISTLRKERLKGSVFRMLNKVLPHKKLSANPWLAGRNVATIPSSISNDAKQVIIEKMGIKPNTVNKPVKANEASIQSLYQNRDNPVVQTHKVAEAHKITNKIGMKVGKFINMLRHGYNVLTGEGYQSGKTNRQEQLSVNTNTSQNAAQSAMINKKLSNDGR